MANNFVRSLSWLAIGAAALAATTANAGQPTRFSFAVSTDAPLAPYTVAS